MMRKTKSKLTCERIDLRGLVDPDGAPYSKYHNRTGSFYGGRFFRSALEARYAELLDVRIAAKDIISWQYEPTVDLRVYNTLVCKYKPDFLLTYPDGHLEYVEVKGFPTPEWRIKWKLFEAIFAVEHPGTVLTVYREPRNPRGKRARLSNRRLYRPKNDRTG